ncbi:MAG: signal recognition particle-docking protein FtsY [Clostridiales bacterium]|jgi:fused signal recognition particle receptor|nr:signal recognition particle-docking protein FtsY [Clostridiales bacterium]
MSSFFQKMLNSLQKTRQNFTVRLDGIFARFKNINDDLYDELEELLILADMGSETSANLITSLRACVKAERTNDVARVRELLASEIVNMLGESEPLQIVSPTTILIIGVNGVGKTTSIGKLAYLFKNEGKKVIVAAADTFRAAAIDQLGVWCNRAKVDMIRHEENSDPGAVIFDAVAAAKSRKADVLICDTAGRLQNKKNLMEELKKLFRIISAQYPEASREVFLTLDATTGQNGLSQARLFSEAANITGIILTKLDGTARGGIVVAIRNAINVPVRYICTGEELDDIQTFDPQEFANALLWSGAE